MSIEPERWPAFAIWPTDRRFGPCAAADNPPACSRCGEAIDESDLPIRCWPADGRFEYRYHVRCLGGR